MATVNERKDRTGRVISYQIRVFRGKDANGHRLKDYLLTWKPAPGMTPRQVQKELQKQVALFEEACRQGNSTGTAEIFRVCRLRSDVKAERGRKAENHCDVQGLFAAH
jgi:hypothetical protein